MKKAGEIYSYLKKYNIEATFKKKVSLFGTGAHIIVPQEYLGKEATIIIHSKRQNKNFNYGEFEDIPK